MGLFRWLSFGTAGYALYKLAGKSRPPRPQRSVSGEASAGGLAALFSTREAADRAIEHLVQEHGVDRSAIFVETAGDRNSVGIEQSGGDAGAMGAPSREDAPLRGALRVTVAIDDNDPQVLDRALAEAGAQEVKAI